MQHKVWSGTVRYVNHGHFETTNGKFLVHDVGVDDTVTIRVADELADPQPLTVIRAHTNDVLECVPPPNVESFLGQEFEMTIERTLVHGRCGECALHGLVREGFKLGAVDGRMTLVADHRHCQWSGDILPDDHTGDYSDDARAMMERMLLTTGTARVPYAIANGKKTVRMHVLTFAENDAVREWQDDFLRKHKDTSDVVYFEQETRARLAVTLDDDGSGKHPGLALANVDLKKFTSFQQLLLRMAYFGQYPDPFYRKLVDVQRRLDGLVEEVCAQPIEDDITDDELMQLGDDLVHNEPVLQTVKTFGGKGMVYFTSVSTDVLDRANAWAEKLITEIRREQGGDVLKVRENELRSIGRLAAEFRGDQREAFDESSTFEDRLDYLMNLVHPMFNMYIHAGNVWRQRAHRAMGVPNLGKS